jgi:Kef-type K+ transport system membrane component KefB
METHKLDEIRAAALTRINRSERNFKLAFLGAGLVESVFIVVFILLADLSNKIHVLLLISTVSSYTIIVLGLVALGAYVNRSVLRVLTAIEASQK